MRNPHAAHIDFSELSDLLGRVVPSNVDMVYERKGSFLVAEWKRDGEKLSKGQEILLKAFAKVPGFTVLIVNGWTENGAMTVKTFWRVLPNGQCVRSGSGLQEFRDYIVEWFVVADGNY